MRRSGLRLQVCCVLVSARRALLHLMTHTDNIMLGLHGLIFGWRLLRQRRCFRGRLLERLQERVRRLLLVLTLQHTDTYSLKLVILFLQVLLDLVNFTLDGLDRAVGVLVVY